MLTCPVNLEGQVNGQGLPNVWKLETLEEGMDGGGGGEE